MSHSVSHTLTQGAPLPQQVFGVDDPSAVGSARRAAQRLAELAGMTPDEAGRLALIATELGNNLVAHARGGLLLLQPTHERGALAIEVLAVDRGPGMRDVQQCLRDGYSTNGTPGTGLGAVKRASTLFEVFAPEGRGCVVLSRVVRANANANANMHSHVHAAHAPETSAPATGTFGTTSQTTRATSRSASAMNAPAPRWRWGAITVPAPGETVIGDCWRLRAEGDDVCVMVADGLGHGPLASAAAAEAARVFDAAPFGALRPFLERAHATMRTTRGAAVAAAWCPGTTGPLRFAGVGNIAGTILSRDGTSRGLMSYNGTVGAEMRTVQELSYEWRAGDRLVLHSDGIMTRWSLAAYPGLFAHHPAVQCAVLHRDFLRGRDDATVVIMEQVAA